MPKQATPPFVFKYIYPNLRYALSLGRVIYKLGMKLRTAFSQRPASSPVIPDAYTVCNTSTIDSDLELCCLEGARPGDLDGSLFLCQCLGAPEAFMVGDTNLVRLDFAGAKTRLTNRLLWTPAALARLKLERTRHRFDFFGLMYLSPGLGMFSYTEGLYLLPDGRIGVTSDVDRPWVVERDSLRAVTPVGRREEWLPMMPGSSGEVMGSLFAAYSNSHVVYSDPEQGEAFLVSYQYRQPGGEHPVRLIRWDGYHAFESWLVVNEQGEEIEIKQSIHELVFTRDYILLADTAFVAGTEMLTPWVNAPLPNKKTVVYLVARRDLKPEVKTVTAQRVEVDEPCIHLIPEYENPNDKITVYMLHIPATNTAEILHSADRDLDGKLFPARLVGYGTLPVLDLSSVGKHVINVQPAAVEKSEYIAELPYCWGPYLYSYMGRQIKPYNGQDLFVMFKGFAKDMLPRRIFDAYHQVEKRRVPLEAMLDGQGMQHNNSICRITSADFAIADAYTFPDRVLLYTMACLTSTDPQGAGYVIAGIVADQAAGERSSGHEYWLFEADNLAKGPVCKLGHESLNNSTLFHTVYIPSAAEAQLAQKPVSYHIPLREDYPRQELENWEACVLQSFEEVIWPYFDRSNPAETRKAEAAASQLAARRVSEHYGREHLIGEEKITDAAAFAERMVAEVERMWRTTGWKVEFNQNGLVVESKPVSGAFESSGVLVTRSVGEIDAPAQATFDMLVSPAGYAVIDPISKPEDHALPPLESYAWREGSRLEAAIATTNLPMLPVGEFVVLNAIDPKARIFVSKSIQHEKRPGGSKYSGAPAPSNGRERALNTFAIKVEAVAETRCRIYCVNYADLAGVTPASINNLINLKVFFPPLYQRIAKAMAKH